MPQDSFCILIDLPASFRDPYLDLQSTVKRALGDAIELESPDKMHLTLVYVGKTDESYREEVARIVSEEAAKIGPIRLQPRGLGTFAPSDSSDSKVPVFIDYVESPALAKLHHRLRERTQHMVGPDTRQFPAYEPHSTLGYYSGTRDEAEAAIEAYRNHRLPTWDVTVLSVTDGTYDSYHDARLVGGGASSRRIKAAAKKYPFLERLAEVSDDTVQEHFRLYQSYYEQALRLMAVHQDFVDGRDVSDPEWYAMKTGLSHALNALKLHEMFLTDTVLEAPDDTRMNLATYAILARKYNPDDVKLLAADIKRTARTIKPGWVVVCYDPIVDRVYVDYCEHHNQGHIIDSHPVAVLDMWEHAYAADYGTDKEQYASQMIGRINWSNAVSRVQTIAKGIVERTGDELDRARDLLTRWDEYRGARLVAHTLRYDRQMVEPGTEDGEDWPQVNPKDSKVETYISPEHVHVDVEPQRFAALAIYAAPSDIEPVEGGTNPNEKWARVSTGKRKGRRVYATPLGTFEYQRQRLSFVFVGGGVLRLAGYGQNACDSLQHAKEIATVSYPLIAEAHRLGISGPAVQAPDPTTTTQDVEPQSFGGKAKQKDEKRRKAKDRKFPRSQAGEIGPYGQGGKSPLTIKPPSRGAAALGACALLIEAIRTRPHPETLKKHKVWRNHPGYDQYRGTGLSIDNPNPDADEEVLSLLKIVDNPVDEPQQPEVVSRAQRTAIIHFKRTQPASWPDVLNSLTEYEQQMVHRLFAGDTIEEGPTQGEFFWSDGTEVDAMAVGELVGSGYLARTGIEVILNPELVARRNHPEHWPNEKAPFGSDLNGQPFGSPDAAAWHDTALFHAQNEDYWRGLLMQIGEHLPESYVSDDGSVQQDPIGPSVVERVVQKLTKQQGGPRAKIHTMEHQDSDQFGFDMEAYKAEREKRGDWHMSDRPENFGRPCEVGITLRVPQEKTEMLWQAEEALRALGLTFDTGAGMGGDAMERDWEWDWSLSGPVEVKFRRWRDAMVQTSPEVFFAFANTAQLPLYGRYDAMNRTMPVTNLRQLLQCCEMAKVNPIGSIFRQHLWHLTGKRSVHDLSTRQMEEVAAWLRDRYHRGEKPMMASVMRTADEGGEEDGGKKPAGKGMGRDPFPAAFKDEMKRKGKTFRSPKTGNKIMFSSLPWPEQLKLYKRWKLSHKGQAHQKAEKHDKAQEDAAKKQSTDDANKLPGEDKKPGQKMTPEDLTPEHKKHMGDAADTVGMDDEAKSELQDHVLKQDKDTVHEATEQYAHDANHHGKLFAAFNMMRNLGALMLKGVKGWAKKTLETLRDKFPGSRKHLSELHSNKDTGSSIHHAGKNHGTYHYHDNGDKGGTVIYTPHGDKGHLDQVEFPADSLKDANRKIDIHHRGQELVHGYKSKRAASFGRAYPTRDRVLMLLAQPDVMALESSDHCEMTNVDALFDTSDTESEGDDTEASFDNEGRGGGRKRKKARPRDGDSQQEGTGTRWKRTQHSAFASAVLNTAGITRE